MKYFSIILTLFLSIIITGTGKLNTRLEFRRDGGGNKEFYISKSDFKKSIVVNITRYNFKDTVIAIDINKKELESDFVNTLTSLFNGRVNIQGDYKQSKLPTGTWAHFFMVDKNSKKYEILNRKLRDELFKLERVIDSKIKN
jgi:hypothetical protein